MGTNIKHTAMGKSVCVRGKERKRDKTSIVNWGRLFIFGYFFMQRDAVACNEFSVVHLRALSVLFSCPFSHQCSSFFTLPSTQEHKGEEVREADYLEKELLKRRPCLTYANNMCSTKSCDLQSHSAKHYPNPQVYSLSLSHSLTHTHQTTPLTQVVYLLFYWTWWPHSSWVQ